MADTKDLGSRWDAVAPVAAIVGGGLTLIILANTLTAGSDWLAVLIAVFLLKTLDRWRPA